MRISSRRSLATRTSAKSVAGCSFIRECGRELRGRHNEDRSTARLDGFIRRLQRSGYITLADHFTISVAASANAASRAAT